MTASAGDAADKSLGPSAFPGFTRLSDQIYSLQADFPSTTRPADSTDPDTIIVFGWGDGKPKNVVKYVDGYRALFPHAHVVIVLATTLKAAYQSLGERTDGMMPVLDAAFLRGPEAGDRQRRVLLHTMSNAGGINLASTLNAYRVRYSGAQLPHQLMVCDSTPGGVVFSQQVRRWSRAMALGMARLFPWPFAFTQALCYAFLWLNRLWEFILRRRHAGAWSREAVNKPDMVPLDTAARLYMYSKEDDIIGWQDIELHAAEARRLGYAAETQMFDGTKHVDHMRSYPDQYWGAITKAWKGAPPLPA